MAKFCGVIGFVETVATSPGLYEEIPTERPYFGDLTRNFGRHEPSGGVNDDVNIANEISIVADAYASEHFFAIKYVKFQLPQIAGVWKVNTIEVAYPRLILTIGGLYNGKTTGASE